MHRHRNTEVNLDFLQKPDYYRLIELWNSRYHINLMFTIFSSNLHKQLVNDIGQQFIRSERSLPSFGIATIVEIFQFDGNFSSENIVIKMFSIKAIIDRCACLIIEHVILSGPLDYYYYYYY